MPSTVRAADPSQFILRTASGGTPRLLFLGAHSDDIEIGCGGTILSVLAAHKAVDCRWIVFSGRDRRKTEAARSASRFLRRARKQNVTVLDFRDGYFPHQIADIKMFFENLKDEPAPDLIFTHYRGDRHQDHRVISELTWNTFRSHCILEYEIPKYDGDLGRPNFYMPLTRGIASAKVRALMSAFASQRSKRWFTPETFSGLMRLRGIESGAATGLAEAFHAHKVIFQPWPR
jgi:LmbE family N-acetylglucosaminyl deacetylase